MYRVLLGIVCNAGLSDAETTIALTLADEVIRGVTRGTLKALRARAAALGVASSATSVTPISRKNDSDVGGVKNENAATPRLRPTFTAAPDATIVRHLLSASGWRDTPLGRCSMTWSLHGTHISNISCTLFSNLTDV